METNLYWSWNFKKGKPALVDVQNCTHQCKNPQTQDIFPGWCASCDAKDLVWLRKNNRFELTESYGLPHPHEQEEIQDLSVAKCKYCKTSGLIWVKRNSKFQLVDPATGLKHTCADTELVYAAWAEAKKIDYAFEKTWINSFKDGQACKHCSGTGHRSFICKNKKVLAKYRAAESIELYRRCKKCKSIGTFTVHAKKVYLKQLRKRYWPFRPGQHKWAKND